MSQHRNLDALRQNSPSTIGVAPLATDAGGRPPASHPPGLPPPRVRWGTRVVLPAGILIAGVLLLAYTARGYLTAATGVDVVPVVVRVLDAKDVGESSPDTVISQAAGWVEPDPFPITISSYVEGVVVDMLALEGQAVKAGERIARLNDQDGVLALRDADAALASARAALDAALAESAAAAQRVEQPVERRAALAQAQEELARAEGEARLKRAEQAAAALNAAEIQDEVRRKQSLVDGGGVGAGEIARLQLRLQSVQADERAAAAAVDVADADVRVKAAARDAAAKMLELFIDETLALKQAEAAVAGARAEVVRAEASRDSSMLALERTHITAPTDGVILRRLAAPGTRLMLGGPDPLGAAVVTLYDPAHLQVRVNVPLADASRIGVGLRARITSDAAPEMTYDGEVIRLVHQANIENNTVQVKVRIAAPDARLRPEMLARVKFLGTSGTRGATPGTASTGLLACYVPRAAIHQVDGSHAIWVVSQAGMTAEERRITLGMREIGAWAHITEGVNPGDRVVVRSEAALQNGDRVRIVREATESDEGVMP